MTLCSIGPKALGNALFMKNRSGVVAIGRDCTIEQPCYWDCACSMLELDSGPSWHQWVHNSEHYHDMSKNFLQAREFQINQDREEEKELKCSPSFANRLCIEMWRPYLETVYIETEPNSVNPFHVNSQVIKEAVIHHVRRISRERGR